MKVYLITKENEEYSHEASDWMKEFMEATGINVEVLDPETVDGEIFVRARDILEYPAVVATDDHEGRVLQTWTGTPLPQFEDVAYFARTV